MHLLHEIARREQIGFARAGRCATNVDPADRAVVRDDHSAAGGAARIGEMTDFDAGDIGDGSVGRG